ncbi:sugar phosphate isomerase/epimerase family protein [Martelella radicis]|uniref:D-psicose/D-tagatose/L-ribulose 3-epimerase n=1 Tax=Martelella radicis TaxID=1397476 RepID=A0A7W6KM09_9HYPH|nr:sugar phosphate isomerase/epimerase [Martelella radicis]MBB4123662.1 D-psicose/D-tagatose/L-ribulose 3-epimerase [Martelella radicis]
MKIGVNTWVWTSPFTTADFDLIPKIGRMGFDVLEVALDDPGLIDAPLLRKAAADNGLAITVCGAFGPTRDIASEDAAIRANGANYIRSSIAFTEAVGSTLFSGPVYSAVGKTRMVPEAQKKREWAWCVETLQDIAGAAMDAGVTVGIEPLNRFESDMVNLTEQALALIDDVGSSAYGIHIDTFHANIEEKSIPEAIRAAGKRLVHVHACENDRGIPGSGHQDWKGIRDALAEIEYDGALVIESFTPGAVEIAKAASIWRPLAPSQDELASAGANYLRNLFG